MTHQKPKCENLQQYIRKIYTALTGKKGNIWLSHYMQNKKIKQLVNLYLSMIGTTTTEQTRIEQTKDFP